MLFNREVNVYVNHYAAISIVLLLLYAFSLLSAISNNVFYCVLTGFLWLALAISSFYRARLKRRLFLLRHIKMGSPLKPWLAGGPLLFILHATITLPLACSLSIVLSQGLGAAGWLQLMLFCYLWPMVYHAVFYAIGKHLQSQSQHYFALTVSFILAALYWLILFVSAGLFSHWPDLSLLSFTEAFYYGKSTAVGESSFLRAMAGVWLGFDSLRLWLTQYLAAAGFTAGINLMIWLMSLLQAALFILPLILLLQGTTGLCEKYPHIFIKPHSVKAAVLTIFLLPAIVLWDQLAEHPWQWLFGKKVTLVIEGNTYALKPQQWDVILTEQLAQLDEKRLEVFHQLNNDVERDIDRLFAQGIRHIPQYADWHYSLTGAGTRALSGVLNNDIHQQMMDKLFVDEAFEQQINRINYLLMRRFSMAQQQFADQLLDQLVQSLANFKVHPHHQGRSQAYTLDVKSLYQDYIAEQLAAIEARQQLTQAAVGGALATVTWVVGRNVMLRAAAHNASRAAPFICVATGPVAIACGALVFSLSTVLIESAILTMDEYQNRAQLEQQLISQLLSMRDDLKQQYQSQLIQMLRTDLSELQDKVQSTVRPIDLD